MNPKLPIPFLILIFSCLLYSCTQKHGNEIRDDFKQIYDAYRVDGSFVLYDATEDHFTFYNPRQYKLAFIPASTFKICNSLIGLETGVIRDENFKMAWDSIDRGNPLWNQDQDLGSAFRNSAVWYYQELARRVGGVRMKYWVDKVNYGNRDTSGGIDRFWLTGKLRITPEQQIDFLRRLHDNRLPFSQRSHDIVKKIMVAADTAGYILRAKTGWSVQDGKDIGWYIGYIENENHLYYFANCIQCDNPDNEYFPKARINIVFEILKKMHILDLS